MLENTLEQREAEGGQKFWRRGLKAELWLRDCCGRIRLVATVEKKRSTGRITGGESAFGISVLLWICFRMQPEAGMTDRETRKK